MKDCRSVISIAASSDGNRIVVGSTGFRNDRLGLVEIYDWTGETSTPSRHDLTESDYDVSSVALSSDGKRLVIGPGSFGSSYIAIIDLMSDAGHRVGWSAGAELDQVHYDSFALSADGTRLAVGNMRNDQGGDIEVGIVKVFALENHWEWH